MYIYTIKNNNIMKNQNWIPEINETVSWGCDVAKVMSINFGGKAVIKLSCPNGKCKIVRNIDLSELEPIV